MEDSHPRDYLGRIVAGKYVIDRLIGAGGFAWVYHAKMVTKREVAVKILHAQGESSMARFHREVEVLRALPTNPYVADFLESGLTIDGRPFLALDFIDGITLLQAMERCEHMEPRYCCAFMAELCSAFTELHRLGVAHRDVKPENILLARDGSIKLIDFGLIRDAQGILKLLEQEDPVDKRVFAEELDHRTLVGTPEYMAPEQFSDAIVSDIKSIRTDTWSDVFSLGVILFEMIGGVVPFPMDNLSVEESMEKEIYKYMRWRIKLTDDDVPKCPGVDEALDSIIRRCLRHDPRHRQLNAGVLRDDLVRYITTGRGVSRTLASSTVAVDVRELDVEGAPAALEEAAAVAAAADGSSSDALTVLIGPLTPSPRNWGESDTYGDVADQYTPTNQNVIIPESASARSDSSKRFISVDTRFDDAGSQESPASTVAEDEGRKTDTNWLRNPAAPNEPDPLGDTLWDIRAAAAEGLGAPPPEKEGSSDLVPAALFGRDRLKSVVQEALATLIEADSISAEITLPYELSPDDLSPDDLDDEPESR